MPPEMPTIAHAFKQAGYRTSYFGKWHVDGFHEKKGRAALHIIPPERRGGFDDWVGYENNNAQWDCWVHGGSGDGAFHYRLGGYETDALSDLLIDSLRQRGREAAEGKGQPFFAVLSVQPPHDPYTAPAEWMARHTPASLVLRPNVPDIPRVRQQARRELAGACAQIENLDWNVGRIRQALVETGLQDDTYIVFFSDHGDMHGSHGQFRKTTMWEEALRIPFIVSRGANRYGRQNDRVRAPINHVDIAPTTLGLCGIDKPDWMEGTDYSGHVVRGRQAGNEPDSAFCQLVVPTGHADSVDRPWRGVVTADGWKYAAFEGQPWMLFNLNEDPYEQANLAHNLRFRHERRALQDRLGQWISDTADRFRLPDDI